ncbi:MAG: serine/threonine protein kinase [Planctomycetaceae bacterium]|nr:MAG: serine/threonine protein kinase [Planctomycetaceae bacterium]
MAMQPGDRLGPYEVLSPIGAGGMGEVYRARDTRLDRTVALKVLPDHIAQREGARARFEREARAVASLSHPNICSLLDICEGYMVMELIDGETLAQRIEKGPIPIDHALTLATQIADALDRAHRAGVTHRDVKPQNIMLTRDGVKVLDFGLAKSSAKPGPTDDTLTKVLTTEGTVVGTPQYMAPEQFEGKEADARSDIWAFGAVLYEMVTGQKAFQGKSYASLVGAILSTDPAPMAVQPLTPAWLERLVRRCLQKDADDRWQSMRDVVIELKSPPARRARPLARGGEGGLVAVGGGRRVCACLPRRGSAALQRDSPRAAAAAHAPQRGDPTRHAAGAGRCRGRRRRKHDRALPRRNAPGALPARRRRQDAPPHPPAASESGDADRRDGECVRAVLLSGRRLDRLLRRPEDEEGRGGRRRGGHVVRRFLGLRRKLGGRRQHHRGTA